MKLRFQADADLNEHIVRGIPRRYPSIDFKTANASALRGLSDLEVLALAAGENRVLVSHDRKSMLRAFATLATERSNPGLFLIFATHLRVGGHRVVAFGLGGHRRSGVGG
jgi:hypothetical protein